MSGPAYRRLDVEERRRQLLEQGADLFTRHSYDELSMRWRHLPFAAGKRACIGGALSQIENTLALVQLLRRFTPEYVGPQPAKIHATVTLCPKGGLPFKIRELA